MRTGSGSPLGERRTAAVETDRRQRLLLGTALALTASLGVVGFVASGARKTPPQAEPAVVVVRPASKAEAARQREARRAPPAEALR